MEINWIDQSGFSYLIPSGLPPITILTACIFYEKRDALKVLCEGTIVKAQYTAMVTVGFLPIPENIDSIRSTFENARFRTVFDNDLPGIVLACKVALWLKGLDAAFLISSNQVIFIFKSGESSCLESLFSLNRFCKLTGFRTNVRPLQMR